MKHSAASSTRCSFWSIVRIRQLWFYSLASVQILLHLGLNAPLCWTPSTILYCSRKHTHSELGVKFLCFIFTFRTVEFYFSTIFHPNMNVFEVKPQEVTLGIYQNKCNALCWFQPKVHVAQRAVFGSCVPKHNTLMCSSSVRWEQ